MANCTRFVFTLALAITSQYAMSQETFQPGYIIRNGGDTLRGVIDYRNWDSNPDKIRFKSISDNTVSTYSPQDIKEFKVADEIYKSAAIRRETTPTETNNLRFEADLNLKRDTVFLQTLVDGNKSLYLHKNIDGRENYYIGKAGDFVLLTYKRYLQVEDGKNMIKENKAYIGELIAYLDDCNTLSEKLATTKYNQKSLSTLFNAYYACSGADVAFEKKAEKMRVDIGVVGGSSITKLSFNGDFYSYLVNGKFDPSVNVAAGMYFDLVIPRNNGKWSIYNELLFAPSKSTGFATEYQNANHYVETNSTLAYNYIRINNMVRYKLPLGKMHIFFNAGMSNALAISEKNHMTQETYVYDEMRFSEGVALPETRKHEQGWLFGTGLKHNRLSFDLRYEKGNGMSYHYALGSKTNRLYLLFGYRLK